MGWKDGQTLFYRTLPATAEGPMNEMEMTEMDFGIMNKMKMTRQICNNSTIRNNLGQITMYLFGNSWFFVDPK